VTTPSPSRPDHTSLFDKAEPMATLSEWSPYDQYVQGGMVDGRYMNAAYTLIAAGPPRLANVGGPAFLAAAFAAGSSAGDQIAYPVGVVQSFSLGHSMQLNRFFEIGSERSYFVPGRVMGQLSLSRIMYHGPSLLRVLYAYYQDLVPKTIVPALFPNIGAGTVANPHDVVIPPGYENIYLNLASDLFKQPVGLLTMFKDSNEDTMASYYFESCYIPQHSLSTDAMGTVMQEQVGIQFERMIPIATTVVGLISGL
jgi:hypothetical protein